MFSSFDLIPSLFFTSKFDVIRLNFAHWLSDKELVRVICVSKEMRAKLISGRKYTHQFLRDRFTMHEFYPSLYQDIELFTVQKLLEISVKQAFLTKIKTIKPESKEFEDYEEIIRIPILDNMAIHPDIKKGFC